MAISKAKRKLSADIETKDDLWNSLGFGEDGFSLLDLETPPKRSRQDDRLAKNVDRVGERIDSIEDRLARLDRENEFANSLLESLLMNGVEPSSRPMYSDILKQNRHYCNYCDLSFHESKDLCTHMMNRHVTSTKKLFYCFGCKAGFDGLRQLENHTQTEHCRAGSCSMCEETDSKPHPLEDMVRMKLVCDFCSYTDGNISSFQMHCLTCTNNPSNENYQPTDEGRVCPTCSQVFSTNAYMLKHISQKHSGNTNQLDEVRKFECDECGRRFVSNASLAGHRKVHKKSVGTTVKIKVAMKPEERTNFMKRHVPPQPKIPPKESTPRQPKVVAKAPVVETHDLNDVEDMPDFF